jgi:hypothetical protein
VAKAALFFSLPPFPIPKAYSERTLDVIAKVRSEERQLYPLYKNKMNSGSDAKGKNIASNLAENCIADPALLYEKGKMFHPFDSS